MEKLILLLLVAVFSSNGAVSNLTAEFRKGKTYITWNEIADTSATYKIYRSASQITNVASLTPVAEIPAGSSYDKRYGFYHIITDTGEPLANGTGLFVYTPKVNGSCYYAVTVSYGTFDSSRIEVGENSTSLPVAEEYWKWPAGVVRQHTTDYNEGWLFFYWMDYEDWPNEYDYYGDLFRVVLTRTNRNKTNLPVYTHLHGYSATSGYGIPSGSDNIGYALSLRDNVVTGAEFAHTWWYGVSNNYGIHPFQKGDTIVDYTAMRYIHYLHAMKNDSRFSIDTNRVYLTGTSMGGGGTLLIGCHYPGLFAAFAPVIGRMNYPEKSFDHRWGSVSLGLTARNGIQIYKWNNVGWILENMRHIEMAPVVDLCGAKDGTHPFYTHSYFYHLMQKNKQAVWGKWANIGHSSGPYGNSIPGGVYRFRRNEMFPAFANASHGNSNYGHMLPADSFNIPEVDANFRFDSLGALNCQFDWSSSLRRLSFPGDSLVDSPESLRVLFVTSTCEYMVDSIRVDSSRVDITPRRLQQFKINPFDKINWKNINVNSGNVVESGSVTADSFGLATIPQFLITSSANRMILEKGDNTSIVKKSGIAATISFSAYPNPFTPMVELKIDGQAAMVSINIRDVNGRIIDNVLLKSGKAVWSGGKKASGIYFAEWNDGEKVHRLKLMYMR